LLKSHGRLIGGALEARAHAALSQAGELEGWQRWRADQLREELVAKAEALTQLPEGQRPGGRKMQETLRHLRDQWKATDQGGQPNHALWKRFDEACNEAYKVVESWLTQVRQQAEVHKAHRLSIIEELKAWTVAHAQSSDWKAQLRELHAFSERWREAGHLSEKAFSDIHPVWKDVMHQAHARLETAQADSVSRRKALIEEATVMGAASPLRLDAVKALQQRWQAEAHAVPLDRKQEQKLWEAFRQPIDEAFSRKSQEREKSSAAMSEHDQRVLDASRALEAASASGDAQKIRSAMAALEAALSGKGLGAAASVPFATAPAKDVGTVSAADTPAGTADAEIAAGGEGAAADVARPSAEPALAPAAAPVVPVKKLVAVRGDDRPGMKKAEPVARDARRGDRPDGRRDGAREGPRGMGTGGMRDGRDDREPRGPRLGDAAFRAQRQAIEVAQANLRKLAAQAHGEVLTQLMSAWEKRDASAMPTAQALGARVTPPVRAAWAAALSKAPVALNGESLLRLEMAADVPTPAEHITQRRLLQLQLLTRRNAPSPEQTWGDDVAQVLSSGADADVVRRLQNVLKALLKR
jgi:hypothetical protein